MPENQRPKSLTLVLLAAFLIQAGVLFIVIPRMGDILAPEYGTGFGDLYDLIANNLAHGNGYRIEANMGETMMREPGYPLFLFLVFKIAGYHIEAARTANLLLTVGISLMLIRLTRRVTGDWVTAGVAALVFLLYPGTLVAEARGGVEIAFIFILMCFMLALHRAVEKGSRRSYFAAGLVLGAVVMVRSTPLLLPVFLFVYLAFAVHSFKERLKLAVNIAVLGLGMALVMVPWVVRNYLLVEEFIPTATVSGVAAQEGQYTCQAMSGESPFRVSQQAAAQQRNDMARQMGVPFEGWYYQYFYAARDEVAFNEKLLQKVRTGYADDPSLLARCAGQNLLNFWFLGKTWQATGQNVAMQLPLLGLALMGLGELRKRGRLREMGIMLTLILYIIVIQAPIIAHARHSIPVVPFLAIPVGVSLVSLWQKYKGRIPLKMGQAVLETGEKY